LTEIKSREDISASKQKNDELFREALPTKKARDAFNNAYDKYFTGKHSDEIYQEVTFGK
jgi:hypothetical protein